MKEKQKKMKFQNISIKFHVSPFHQKDIHKTKKVYAVFHFNNKVWSLITVISQPTKWAYLSTMPTS